MLEFLIKQFTTLIEVGLMPDWVTRIGMRKLLNDRLLESKKNRLEDPNYLEKYVQKLKSSPLAIMTSEANLQHYEVPTAFYDLALGSHKKYSSCFWDQSTYTLKDAEQKALDLSIEHAQIIDGMRILELGCGWGSLSLELAKRFPNSLIVSVSNSQTQKKYIDQEAQKRGLANLKVLTKDLSLAQNYDFGPLLFDRVMSIEMMEHLRNYELFFKNLAPFVKKDGKFFIHIFTHKTTPYYFEVEGEDNWMGRYFFSGGQMPSRDLLDEFNADFKIIKKWDWSGIHYSKTLEAWLKLTDMNKKRIKSLFSETYDKNEATVWFNRWRMFFMACSELFKYNEGQEWGVTHYLMEKKDRD